MGSLPGKQRRRDGDEMDVMRLRDDDEAMQAPSAVAWPSRSSVGTSQARASRAGVVPIHREEAHDDCLRGVGNDQPPFAGAKHGDMVLRPACREPRKACPCSNCETILDEHLVALMREAGEAALRCGHESGFVGTVVWDNAGYVHVYVPRSKRDPHRRKPPTLRRETAITTLYNRWAKFRHGGEVPGPTERTEAGSSLGWYDLSFWRKPAASALRGKRNFIPGVAKTKHWLVDSGGGFDLVDAQNMPPHGGRCRRSPGGPRDLQA